MLWLTYNILFTLGFIALLPHFLWRMLKRDGYRKHFSQRLGFYNPEIRRQFREKELVWVHAVSVGEVYLGLRFIEELRSKDPHLRFVLSVTTSTGFALAEQKIAPSDIVIYFPVDFSIVVKRVLDTIRPQRIILVEGEFWPNLIRRASARGIPVVLVNGRISDSSYRRYLKLRCFTKSILKQIDPICVQSESDRQKVIALGAPTVHVHVMGSAKYEIDDTSNDGEQSAQKVLHAIHVEEDAIILLGGSTWPGEEPILLNIYRRLKNKYPSLILILVPRHVERASEIITEIKKAGLRVVCRTEAAKGIASQPDVLLVNTTGELKHFYACADIIFVGKSLTEHGGQNIIEPALYGKPIIVGPHMENFLPVMEDFVNAQAIVQVPDTRELETKIAAFSRSPEMRAHYGERARKLVHAKRGAVKNTVDKIMNHELGVKNKLVKGSGTFT